ncbi:hypothetical protein RvY_00214-1, partial [Ramazzottius varieornatus]
LFVQKGEPLLGFPSHAPYMPGERRYSSDERNVRRKLIRSAKEQNSQGLPWCHSGSAQWKVHETEGSIIATTVTRISLGQVMEDRNSFSRNSVSTSVSITPEEFVPT